MNLLKETINRLNYQYSKLADLNKCLDNAGLSESAKHYIKSEIYKVNSNIKYYEELKESLKDGFRES